MAQRRGYAEHDTLVQQYHRLQPAGNVPRDAAGESDTSTARQASPRATTHFDQVLWAHNRANLPPCTTERLAKARHGQRALVPARVSVATRVSAACQRSSACHRELACSDTYIPGRLAMCVCTWGSNTMCSYTSSAITIMSLWRRSTPAIASSSLGLNTCPGRRTGTGTRTIRRRQRRPAADHSVQYLAGWVVG